MNTKCLSAAVELHIPDILSKGPKTLDSLAKESGARADRLRQIMRILYNNGIFSYDRLIDTYSNNHTSTMLQSDHWTQWHNWVQLYGSEFYDMARGIPGSVHKDATRTPAQINYNTDMDMFSYFSERGWVPRLHRTLGGGAIAQAPGILEDYPWGEVADKTVLDVGGGGGGFITSLLRQHKTMHGGIFDLPKVIEHAGELFHSPGGQFADVGDRIPKKNLIAGDFFKQIPSFEVYTMKWCLHDWDDSQASSILRNIRAAILPGPKSRLILLEFILKDGRMGRLSRYGDVHMMLAAGGEERAEDQWKHLAAETGWEVAAIYSLRSAWPSAIELKPLSN